MSNGDIASEIYKSIEMFKKDQQKDTLLLNLENTLKLKTLVKSIEL